MAGTQTNLNIDSITNKAKTNTLFFDDYKTSSLHFLSISKMNIEYFLSFDIFNALFVVTNTSFKYIWRN